VGLKGDYPALQGRRKGKRTLNKKLSRSHSTRQRSKRTTFFRGKESLLRDGGIAACNSWRGPASGVFLLVGRSANGGRKRFETGASGRREDKPRGRCFPIWRSPGEKRRRQVAPAGVKEAAVLTVAVVSGEARGRDPGEKGASTGGLKRAPRGGRSGSFRREKMKTVRRQAPKTRSGQADAKEGTVLQGFNRGETGGVFDGEMSQWQVVNPRKRREASTLRERGSRQGLPPSEARCPSLLFQGDSGSALTSDFIPSGGGGSWRVSLFTRGEGKVEDPHGAWEALFQM